jgi:hypothetical protein
MTKPGRFLQAGSELFTGRAAELINQDNKFASIDRLCRFGLIVQVIAAAFSG